MENLDPQIQQRFKELPKMVQQIITDSGWEEAVREIVRNNSLRLDQGSIIETEVFLVMLGFENSKDFVNNLEKEAGLSNEISVKIAEEINQAIFEPIKQKLVSGTDPENQQDIPESKEDILNHIETVDDEKPETPIQKESKIFQEQQKPAEKPQTLPQKSEPQNKLGQKLGGHTTQKEEISLDPYREPVE